MVAWINTAKLDFIKYVRISTWNFGINLVDTSKGQAKFHECIKETNTAGENHWEFLLFKL